MFAKLLQFKLTILAKLYLAKYKPEIIAVTGNVGKTSTKEAIGAVLATKKTVRVAGGNLNNELGVPLAILGDWAEEYYDKGPSLSFWSRVIASGLRGLLSKIDYPEVLVLEYGADHPGDIRRLSLKFKPHISVVTAVGKVPVHVEFFKSPEGLASEKASLVKYLNEKDIAILNHDDDQVLAMREKTKAKVLTYGFNENSSARVHGFDFMLDERGYPLGVSFKIHSGENSFVPVKISGSLGNSQAYAAAAAMAVGLQYDMNLVEMSEALSHHQGPKGRLKILSGIKHSIIIDDTYNASPASTSLALETMRDIPMKRKIAVLGNMLELGKYSMEAHDEIGDLAGSVADVLVCVGDKAHGIATAAAKRLSQDNIYTFNNSNDAKLKVQELIQEGDLILVKGSQGVRMERIVEEIMAHPENKKDLLVRQSNKWISK